MLAKGSADQRPEGWPAVVRANVGAVFEDGVYEVPSCYYEFGMRYRMPSGEEFSGFIKGSADKIFESANHR